jgi:hypothetical protein
MNDKEAIEMMERCVGELQQQRAEIASLAPQAEAYQVLREVVRLAAPRHGGMMSEDLVWRLTRKIEELKKMVAKGEAAAVKGASE